MTVEPATGTAWLVQTNVMPESVTPEVLRRACADQGQRYVPITVPPGSVGMPALDEDVASGPVVFHGRSTLILNALASRWWHGVFFDPAVFCHRAYAEGFGDRFVNAGALVMTWRELVDRSRLDKGTRFVKPNDDFKSFTGQPIALSLVRSFADGLVTSLGPGVLDQEVVVAPVREVDAEWRLFVVDGEVVSGSMYRPSGGAHLPADMLAFARSAIRAWTPAPVFTLDIGRVDGGWVVIECNCFNASRFYDADASAVVRAVSEYQAHRFARLPTEGPLAAS